MAKSEIRVRMAPSPTGYAHVGSARTALFNWLFARHEGGKFILRIEDTDKERSKKEYEEDMLQGLKWLGLEWDEFYRQSDRLPIYSKYIQKLLDGGRAFRCYHSEEELEKERQEQLVNKAIPRHACEHKRQAINDKRQAGGIIRLAVDENSDRKIKFNDLIRGEIEFEERLLGDFSIAKNTETALYNFAAVIDDYEMEISHIIRGEDHIANTPKQILIQEALGFEGPQYAHLPLLLGKDKSKLSKRHGAVSLTEYRNRGYLARAMFNFLALLGFTPPEGKEILSQEELVGIFDLAGIHKSGAVFDTQKLDWMNKEYLRKLSDSEFLDYLAGYFKERKPEKDYLAELSPLFRERIGKFEDIAEFNYFFEEPDYEKTLLVWKDKSEAEIKEALLEVEAVINKAGVEDGKKLRESLDELGKKIGDRGTAYWPFRVALSGRKASPDPVQIARILGKGKTLERVKRAVEKLG